MKKFLIGLLCLMLSLSTLSFVGCLDVVKNPGNSETNTESSQDSSSDKNDDNSSESDEDDENSGDNSDNSGGDQDEEEGWTGNY